MKMQKLRGRISVPVTRSTSGYKEVEGLAVQIPGYEWARVWITTSEYALDAWSPSEWLTGKLITSYWFDTTEEAIGAAKSILNSCGREGFEAAIAKALSDDKR